MITKAMFTHWMTLTAIKNYEVYPQGPVPSWVIPDPPRYTACIAHLQATAGKDFIPDTDSSAAQAKTGCEQQYAALREQVLDSLITAQWLVLAGQARGLTATAGEVTRRFERVTKNQFANEATFKRYLAATGETIADQLFRSRIKVYSEKIEKQIAGSRDPQREFRKFVDDFAKEWAAKTTCRPGYVAPDCRQYRGRSAPAIKLL
ncbi:MAG: hypothetical protein ACLP1Q_07890 [Solirubrobacteraceae bacterium]